MLYYKHYKLFSFSISQKDAASEFIHTPMQRLLFIPFIFSYKSALLAIP